MSRFPSAAHLAAWAGLAPAMHESAGRQTPAGKRHGNKWLTAMINGETDPVQLADLAKGRMRRKIPDLAQALTGTFDVDHAQLAKSMLRRLELVELALAELDAVIVEACRPWQHQIELLQTIPGVGETVAQVIVA